MDIKTLPNQYIPEIFFASDNRNAIKGIAEKYYINFLENLGLNEDNEAYVHKILPEQLVARNHFNFNNRKDVYDKIPTEIKKNIETCQSFIAPFLKSLIYIPQNINVKSSELTLLASESPNFIKGTVANVLTLQDLDIIYLFPRITFDLSNGKVQLNPTGNLKQSFANDISKSGSLNDIGKTVGEIIDKIVETIQTEQKLAGKLEEVLPSPWGVAISAGIDIIELILGFIDDDHQPTPLELAINALESFMDQMQITRWTTNINSFLGGSDGINTQLKALAAVQTMEGSVSNIEQLILPVINRAVSAGDTDNLAGSVEQLFGYTKSYVETAKSESVQDFFNKMGPNLEATLDSTIIGISTLILSHKIRIQLIATMASYYKEQNQIKKYNEAFAQWMFLYNDFKIMITDATTNNGWADRMLQILPTARDARLALVGEVYRKSFEMGHGTLNNGWSFIDAQYGNPHDEHIASPWNLAPPNENTKLDTETGSCCSPHVTEHKDEVVANRKNYIDHMTDRFNDREKNVKNWLDAIKGWGAILPPAPPKLRPNLLTEKDWKSKTPQGSNWVAGNEVQYAMAFVNSKGPSEMGDWCAPISIHEQAFPTIGLPTDPSNSITERWLFRRFAQTKDLIVIVAKFKDNTTQTYLDDNL